MSTPSTSLPPAGWYPDPEAPGQQRWWSGAEWAPSSPAQSAPHTNTLAILGLLAGILAISAFMAGPFAISLGAAGIILSALGLKNARTQGAGLQLARWALAVSIFGAGLAVLWNLIT